MNKFVKIRGHYIELGQIEGWSEIKRTLSGMPYFDIYTKSGRCYCIDTNNAASIYNDFFDCINTYNKRPEGLKLLTIIQKQ